MDNNGWWNLGRNALIRKDTESREPRKLAVSWGLLGNRGVCVWGGGGLPDWGAVQALSDGFSYLLGGCGGWVGTVSPCSFFFSFASACFKCRVLREVVPLASFPTALWNVFPPRAPVWPPGWSGAARRGVAA